jgi:hypothetical protein
MQIKAWWRGMSLQRKKGGVKKGQNNNISWGKQYNESIYVGGDTTRWVLFDRNIIYIQHVLTDLKPYLQLKKG